jgi:hypothetical protein
MYVRLETKLAPRPGKTSPIWHLGPEGSGEAAPTSLPEQPCPLGRRRRDIPPTNTGSSRSVSVSTVARSEDGRVRDFLPIRDLGTLLLVYSCVSCFMYTYVVCPLNRPCAGREADVPPMKSGDMGAVEWRLTPTLTRRGRRRPYRPSDLLPPSVPHPLPP